MKPSNVRRPAVVGQDAFEQLRDIGGRLDYIVSRYGRLVMDVADGRPLPDMRDSVELMNNQLGYVARRLQEILLGQYDERQAEADTDGVFGREVAMASR